MNNQQLRKWSYLLALVLALLILLLPAAAWAVDEENTAPPTQPFQLWNDDLSYVKYVVSHYAFYDLDDQVMQAKDVPSLIAALQKTDPWAAYYTAEEFSSFMQDVQGDFVGIGVYVKLTDDQLVVQGTIANTPAEKAGLKNGDIIVGVDDLTAPQATAEELMTALSGEENSLVIVKYQRDGKVLEAMMNRKSIIAPSMEYWLMDNGIGYAQITQFTSHTGEEMSAAVTSLKKQGMKALILDLRYCPGGELSGAVDTSAVLAGGGPMIFFVDRMGWYNFDAVDDATPLSLPLAVLINGETASAAELVAANIQDSGYGVLVGTPSYGKGVMQSMLQLPSGAGIKFTTSKYMTHGYQDIDAEGGLMPNIYVSDEETQQDAAITWINEQLAKPSFLKFYANLNGYSLGGVWQNDAVKALLHEGSAYVPLELTLSQLGWQQEERDGLLYFASGSNRLIADIANQQLITAIDSQPLISQGGVTYFPATELRRFGYSVTWDSSEQSVRIGK